MSMRAKFQLNSIIKREQTYNGELKDVRDLNFTAVYDGSEENKKYWEATPAGSLVLSVVNEAAWSQFEQGKSYYLDITPAGE